MVMDTDLSGRTARCTYYRTKCRNERPSARSLAFFQFQGEGSSWATEYCATCGMRDLVHQETNPMTGRPGRTDHPFEPKGPAEFDCYYCGCYGWD